MSQQLPIELQRRHKFTLLLTQSEVDKLTKVATRSLRSKSSIVLEGTIANIDKIESEQNNRRKHKIDGAPTNTSSGIND
jgi:hypothetical protein